MSVYRPWFHPVHQYAGKRRVADWSKETSRKLYAVSLLYRIYRCPKRRLCDNLLPICSSFKGRKTHGIYFTVDDLQEALLQSQKLVLYRLEYDEIERTDEYELFDHGDRRYFNCGIPHRWRS